ncbi:MAG TPA: S41 family peptidase [Longimicrobiales bacterium]|nr:S41 family peptidase [Longimicrobiales bacterium]
MTRTHSASPPRERPRPSAVHASAWVLAATTLLAGCGGAVSAPADAPTPSGTSSETSRPISTELALQTFDSAWSRINASYYDPDFRGIDWPGIRDELRPRAAEVSTREELRTVLRDMLSRLGESHFAILPEESVRAISIDDDGVEDLGDAGPGDVGLDLRWVDGRLMVFKVREGPAGDAGVSAGWTVAAVGEQSTGRWEEIVADADSERARITAETQTVQGAISLMTGPVGSEVPMTLVDGEGDTVSVSLPRQPVRGQMVRFGQLPAMASWLEWERIPAPGQPGACVGVIEFNIWMVPLVAPFNQAVDALDDCMGIVIDLRGNPGGVGGMVMSTAGSFFAERADLGTLKSRAGELNFVAMPRGVDTEGALRDAFDGRLAVLIDEMSMSTSEIFAAGLKSTGRARLFGSTTPGYALPAATLPLPSGDVLYHVISNLTDPEGRRIEGSGVAPDVEVGVRREALLSGVDEALDAAIVWAAGGGGR